MENNEIELVKNKLNQLELELSYLNKLLIDCGFENGVQTLKATAEELLSGIIG